MIGKILNFIMGEKKQSLGYPREFLIINYSPHALRVGSKSDQTKVIYRYFLNKYGNSEIKEYPYSQERVYTLQKTHSIPAWDKTKQKTKFPVFSTITPGEIKLSLER